MKDLIRQGEVWSAVRKIEIGNHNIIKPENIFEFIQINSIS
jgi:hypothetical protein